MYQYLINDSLSIIVGATSSKPTTFRSNRGYIYIYIYIVLNGF